MPNNYLFSFLQVYPPRYSRTDESFHQFQERIRCIRQRSRDRLDQVRRMSHQAQERLALIHDSINRVRHGRRPLESISDPAETNNENENREVFEGNENNDNVSNLLVPKFVFIDNLLFVSKFFSMNLYGSFCNVSVSLVGH